MGDQIKDLDFCEICVLGKSHRVKFGSGKRETKGILYYIHFVLWGLTRTISYSGGRYFMSIVDDFSRKI